MRALLACLLAAPIAMTLAAQDRTITLDDLRDTTRPLLVFGKASDPRIGQQYDALNPHIREMKDRDMRFFLLVQPLDTRYAGDGHAGDALSPEEQRRVRQRFHVGEDEFAVILVGKDGGEKLRSSTPIPWQKLASTIDAMPMRKDEMKQR